MDCRDFRDKHSLYVDLRCSALEESEMRQHLRVCATCSRHDTIVRRSLLIVRNLPEIEPSPGFRARLDARLRAITPFSAAAPRAAPRPPHLAFVVVAASLAFMAFLATTVLRRASNDDLRLAPVIASVPETEPSAIATAAFVATVPTGMSVWPAIMVASQAPTHFVTADMRASVETDR